MLNPCKLRRGILIPSRVVIIDEYWLRGYHLNSRLDENNNLWKLYYLDGYFIKKRLTTVRKIKKIVLLINIHKTNEINSIEFFTNKLINL